VSATELQVEIGADDVSATGNYSITVYDERSGQGGVESAASTFRIVEDISAATHGIYLPMLMQQ
jgi:hypothetical protein